MVASPGKGQEGDVGQVRAGGLLPAGTEAGLVARPSGVRGGADGPGADREVAVGVQEKSLDQSAAAAPAVHGPIRRTDGSSAASSRAGRSAHAPPSLRNAPAAARSASRLNARPSALNWESSSTRTASGEGNSHPAKPPQRTSVPYALHSAWYWTRAWSARTTCPMTAVAMASHRLGFANRATGPVAQAARPAQARILPGTRRCPARGRPRASSTTQCGCHRSARWRGSRPGRT